VRLKSKIPWPRRSLAVRYLDDLLHWHLSEWEVGLPMVRQRLEDLTGTKIDDEQSTRALRRLLGERPPANRGPVTVMARPQETQLPVSANPEGRPA
jgi:hypothetical protein